MKRIIFAMAAFLIAAVCAFSAEKPEKAERMYMKAAELIRNEGINTELGVFGAHMEIEYMNPGPATFILDSSCFSDAQTRRKNGKDSRE